MLIFIYLFAIAGIGFILLGLNNSYRASGLGSRLPRDIEQTGRSARKSLLSFTLPFSQMFLEKLKLHARIKNKLDAAHIRLSVNEFFNLALLIFLGLAALTVLVLGRLDLLALAIVFILAFALPAFWVYSRLVKRREEIVRLLPESVDLLGLCVEAGLDFTTAVKWIVEKTAINPMVEELAYVLEEIKWGKPRNQALRDMARRLNIGEVTSFAQTLIQAERMGTPVAEAFAMLSEDTRLQRFRRGERFALRAPIKILIPLVFCILPVILIVVGGPIILKFIQGGLLK